MCKQYLHSSLGAIFALCLSLLSTPAAAFAPQWEIDGDAPDGTDPVGGVVIWHVGGNVPTSSMQAAVIAALCNSTQPIDILEDARSYTVNPNSSGATDMEKAGVARPGFWSVACQIKGGVTGLTAGNKLLWNTREEGGSGVGPVALDKSIGFMKPSTPFLPDLLVNCPGNGNYTNNYTRTILLPSGYSVSVTVWNCVNFVYTWTASGVGSVPATFNEQYPTSNAVMRAMDIGTSDIEPDKFSSNFSLNVPSADMNLDGVTNASDALPAYDTSGLTSAPVALLTFGVPVNVRMYQDLQRAQFPSGHPLFNDCNPDSGVSYGNVTAAVYDGSGNATSGGILDARNNANLEKCMPSLTGNEIRSIAARGSAIRNSTDMQYETTFGGASFATLSAMAKGATSNSIQFCRYANGLGVQAQFNAIFLDYPCDPTGDGTIDTLQPEILPWLGAMLNQGSGDVEKCLNDFNDGTNTTAQNLTELGTACTTAAADCKKRWAIGIQSLEKNAPNLTTGVFGSKYRFIKVDGFAPTLANVHAGDYYDVASQSLQYNHSLPAARLAVAYASFRALTTGFALPTGLQNANNLPALNKTHAFGVAGWLGIPSNSLASNIPTAALDLTRPVSWYRRVSGTNSGGSTSFNTCVSPSMFRKTGAGAVSSATVGPQNCTSNGGADGNCYTP